MTVLTMTVVMVLVSQSKMYGVSCLDQARQAVASITSAVINGTLLSRLRTATGLPISHFAFTKQPTISESAETNVDYSTPGDSLPTKCSASECNKHNGLSTDYNLV